MRRTSAAVNPGRGWTATTAGVPDRQRAGLVDDERVDFLRPLERRRVAHENAASRSLSDADHQRGRCRESQRARARDDQHGGRAHQRRAPVAEREAIADERDRRDDQHRRDEPRGHGVGKTLNRRLRSLRGRHLADDAGEKRRLTDGGRLAAQRTGFVDGSREHAVARPFRDRPALAGQHRLVDRGFAGQHAAIDRHARTRTHDEHVTDDEVRERNLRHVAVALAQHRGRPQREQLTDCSRGLRLRARPRAACRAAPA